MSTINKKDLSESDICDLYITPAEQHRIVAKVDDLFALCDALKERQGCWRREYWGDK